MKKSTLQSVYFILPILFIKKPYKCNHNIRIRNKNTTTTCRSAEQKQADRFKGASTHAKQKKRLTVRDNSLNTVAFLDPVSEVG